MEKKKGHLSYSYGWKDCQRPFVLLRGEDHSTLEPVSPSDSNEAIALMREAVDQIGALAPAPCAESRIIWDRDHAGAVCLWLAEQFEEARAYHEQLLGSDQVDGFQLVDPSWKPGDV